VVSVQRRTEPLGKIAFLVGVAMDFWTKLGLALAIAGVGVSIVFYFATYIWREMPRWLAICGFSVGIFLCVSAMGCFAFISEPERPDVSLRLVHPAGPMLVLDNNSGVIARDTKKTIGIWNADDLRTYIPGSSGNDPLPIPISTFDVLRPHVSSGPEGLFQQSVNSGYIKSGDRLIGSIGVVCPTCSRGHTYFVYIVWGKDGWYTEVSAPKEGEIVIPSRITKENLQTYFKSIEQTPQSKRHAIMPAS